MMFQMLQTICQFSRAVTDDPRMRLKQFTKVAKNSKSQKQKTMLSNSSCSPYSLNDGAKSCLNSSEPNSVATQREVEKFSVNYFPMVLDAKKRNDITFFKQTNEETLFEAWERFKELLRRCNHHGIPECIRIKIFYNRHAPLTRLMLDAL